MCITPLRREVTNRLYVQRTFCRGRPRSLLRGVTVFYTVRRVLSIFACPPGRALFFPRPYGPRAAANLGGF